MSRSKYIRPSLRCINIRIETLLCQSGNTVAVDHEEGVWDADANQESNFNTIWECGEQILSQ